MLNIKYQGKKEDIKLGLGVSICFDSSKINYSTVEKVSTV
jgi:hypothetical protein